MRSLLVVAALMGAAAGAAFAQAPKQSPSQTPAAKAEPSKPEPPRIDPPKPEADKPEQAATVIPPVPGPEQLLYLIRTTLMTLHGANITGNYTVLRDIASPAMQARNSAADLSAAFADLRRRGVDVGMVALVTPQLASEPYVDDQGILVLRGLLPLQPVQINFELQFMPVINQWRMSGMAVGTQAAPPMPAEADKTPDKTPDKK